MSAMNRCLILVAVIAAIAAAGVVAVAQTEYTVIVLASPPAGGTVDGSGTYPAGADVSLTAHPNLGYRFVGWMEGGVQVSTAPQLKFTANRDRRLTAKFAPIPVKTEIGGRWDLELQFLPNIAFQTSRLEFDFTQTNDALTAELRLVSTFTSGGWTGFTAWANAQLGSVQASANLTFNPVTATYLSSAGSVNFNLFGIYWSLRVNHSAVGGGTFGPYILYSLFAWGDGVSVTVRADQTDCCLAFHDALINMSSCGLSLCDGIPVQGSLSFTRDEGFSYLQLSAQNIAKIWDGISIDARLKLTPTSKAVTVTPHWTNLGNTNFTFYGNADWHDGTLAGITLYGLKIRCCFDCGSCPGAQISAPYVEFLTGFDPTRVPGGFQGDEFEYWKAGFCGPASCCTNGFYTVEATAYFSHSSAGLFALSRVKLDLTYPLFPGFTFDINLEMDIVGGHNLVLGWHWMF